MHVGVPEDPYIKRSDLETVDVELHSSGTVLAAVNTVLDPDQEDEALDLAREIAAGLEARDNSSPLTDEEVDDLVGGNLCRCTGYANIKKAVHHAAAAMKDA